MDDAVHLQALGRVVRESAELELFLAGVLQNAAGIAQGNAAAIIAAHSSASAIMGMLRSLAAAEDPVLSGAEYKEWLAAAGRAFEARNRVLHSQWVTLPEGPMRVVVKQGRFEPQSAQDVEEVADEIRAVKVGLIPWLPAGWRF